MYRKKVPTNEECSFFSSAHGTFAKRVKGWEILSIFISQDQNHTIMYVLAIVELIYKSRYLEKKTIPKENQCQIIPWEKGKHFELNSNETLYQNV